MAEAKEEQVEVKKSKNGVKRIGKERLYHVYQRINDTGEEPIYAEIDDYGHAYEEPKINPSGSHDYLYLEAPTLPPRFGFGKKKKKKSAEEYPGYCPFCAQKSMNINASQSTAEVYEEKQRMLKEEAMRKNPNFVEPKPEIKPSSQAEVYREGTGSCKCTRCRRERGEDPLTVELLPMDTQVTLQNSLLQSSLQDAGFMCNIL